MAQNDFGAIAPPRFSQSLGVKYMEPKGMIKIFVGMIFFVICIIVFLLGDSLERNERFANVALAAFGAFYIFPVVCKTNMYMTGFTAEPGNQKHISARVVGFIGGFILIVWAFYRALDA